MPGETIPVVGSADGHDKMELADDADVPRVRARSRTTAAEREIGQLVDRLEHVETPQEGISGIAPPSAAAALAVAIVGQGIVGEADLDGPSLSDVGGLAGYDKKDVVPKGYSVWYPEPPFQAALGHPFVAERDDDRRTGDDDPSAPAVRPCVSNL